MATILKKIGTDSDYSLYFADGMYFFTSQSSENEIPLSSSWNINGVYLFAGAVRKEHISAFIKRTAAFTAQAGDSLTFLWIDSPDGDAAFFRPHGVFVSRSEARAVEKIWGFRYPPYSVNICAGAQVSCSDSGFAIQKAGSYAVCLQTPAMLLGNAGTAAAIGTDGILSFDVSAQFDENIAEKIGIGIKYSAPLPEDTDAEKAYEAGMVATYSNSVFQNMLKLHLKCSLCPQEPFNTAKTQFLITDTAETESSFTSLTGKPLTIEMTDSSALVFEKTPAFLYGENREFSSDLCYLGLSGGFALKNPAQTDGSGQNLICGFSGTEFIDFSAMPEKKLNIIFKPSCNGFTDTAAEKLTGVCTCPWISLPASAGYFCQSKNSPLFAPDAAKNLIFLPMPLLTVKESDPSVPLVPYRHGSLNLTEYVSAGNFEKIIYGTRFDTLTGGIASRIEAEEDAEIPTVTPQGILVAISASGSSAESRWKRIILANSGTFGSEDNYLALKNIDAELLGQFSRINMHIVFDTPESLSKYVGASDFFTADIDDWQFLLNPADWLSSDQSPETNTLFLIKYCRDRSVREILSGSEVFSASLSACYDRDGNVKSGYEQFLSVTDDTDFMGVVVLNCRLKADTSAPDFNQDLKMILSGIENIDELYAHHLIIQGSRTGFLNTGLFMQASKIDALAVYQDGQPVSYGDQQVQPDYKFTTTALTVSVKDSHVDSIATESELLINRLFDEACSKSGDGGNCLLIDGSMNKSGGYSQFGYRLRSEGLYSPEKSVLELVDITSLSLSGGDTFSLGGKLFFKPDENCDLFSYGKDSENNDFGLPMDGLKLIMKDKKPSDINISYSDMKAGMARARTNSLADRFPAVLEQILSEPLSLPENLGYVSVNAPISQSKLAAPWFGLCWRIPLGSLGDLSDSIVDIRLLTAWSGGDSPGLYAGVKFPSLFSGLGLNLQGLVNLGFNSVSLTAEKTVKDSSEITDFSMIFNQFAAKVLWFSFPPGTNRIKISADETGKHLGWLAEYRGEEE